MVELIRDYFPIREGSKAIVLIYGPKRIMDDPRLERIVNTLRGMGKIPSQVSLMRSVNGDASELCVDLLVFE